MTYQGERARPLASDNSRFFEVSSVHISADGRISDLLWGEIDASSDRDVGQRVRASAAEVVEAIHAGTQVAAVFTAGPGHQGRALPERAFMVVQHADGHESLALAGGPSPGRELADMDQLDG
ncbi:hypothetical protein DBR42_18625 [Pelomonas sp. HMWF004]|nr:hypothetical protein DBR42_18625 [Pelomonas sp. HMWF004]